MWTKQVENNLKAQRLDLKVARIVAFDRQALSEIQQHPQQSTGSDVALIQTLDRDQSTKEKNKVWGGHSKVIDNAYGH